MRVTDVWGNDTEALGPALWAGKGEVYIVRGEPVDYLHFRKMYVPQPERRARQRRQVQGRRWRDTPGLEPGGRNDNRRIFARRMRDRLSEGELFELACGRVPV
jgi:hypothetical protein